MQGLPQILDRIDQRLAKLGLSDNAASVKAGKKDAIRNARRALNSPNRSGITLSTLEALAGALGTTVSWLADGSGAEEVGQGDAGQAEAFHNPAVLTEELRAVRVGESVPIRISGKVEAGAFRSVDDLGDNDDAETFMDTRDERYPYARHLGFVVEGDSMNALKPQPILPGNKLSALAYEDIDANVPLRDGMIVVVERSRYDGQEREWSVKQLQLYEDRVEFHPRSTNPRHKPIIVRRDGQADDGTKVEIIALVRRTVNEFAF